jgi:hypothetical protein
MVFLSDSDPRLEIYEKPRTLLSWPLENLQKVKDHQRYSHIRAHKLMGTKTVNVNPILFIRFDNGKRVLHIVRKVKSKYFAPSIYFYCLTINPLLLLNDKSTARSTSTCSGLLAMTCRPSHA